MARRSSSMGRKRLWREKGCSSLSLESGNLAFMRMSSGESGAGSRTVVSCILCAGNQLIESSNRRPTRSLTPKLYLPLPRPYTPPQSKQRHWDSVPSSPSSSQLRIWLFFRFAPRPLIIIPNNNRAQPSMQTIKRQHNPHFSHPYHQTHELSISNQDIHRLQQINYPHPENIQHLTITHCNLHSLDGIEQFINLQTLNVKYNNLREADSLYLIGDKSKITELNIQGNDIEYYAACTFSALRANGFNNLVMLNNKDYSRWGLKKKKAPTIRNICSSMKKVEKDMVKTLKRTVKNNVTEKYRLQAEEIYEGEQDEQATSRVSQRSNQTYGQAYNSHQRSTKQKSYNQESDRVTLKDISLSNANMVKSLKIEYLTEGETKGLGKPHHALTLDPVGFNENQISHMPMTQPTATFAAQRQKQNMPFRSRNSRRSINLVLEDGDEDDHQDISFESQVPHHTQRYSVTRSVNRIEKSIFDDKIEGLEEDKEDLAYAVYLSGLMRKVFDALQPRNMPRQMDLYY